MDYAELMRMTPGLPGSSAIRHFRPQWSDEQVLASQREQLESEYADTTDMVAAPSAAEVLSVVASRGLPWAVVTSADRRLAGIRLAAADIAAPVVVTREDVVEGKPAPEGFLTAALVRLPGIKSVGCVPADGAEIRWIVAECRHGPPEVTWLARDLTR